MEGWAGVFPGGPGREYIKMSGFCFERPGLEIRAGIMHEY